MHFVPFNVPPVTSSDLDYAGKAIERGKVAGSGTFTTWSEQLLKELIGAQRALLTSSCTHALEMAAMLIDLKPGDEVIVPAFTFVSTANAFCMRGATPVFADVIDKTLNVDARTIAPMITGRTRAVCVVHYGGVAVDMDPVVQLCNDRGIALVEDNAHGIFAKYKNRQLGTFGQLGALSFHETKNLSCGEGGALLINDERLIDRAEVLREKGTNRKKFLLGAIDRYTWVDIGSSWVISEILAAILFAQLERREEILNSRSHVYRRYDEGLSDWAKQNSVRIPFVPEYAEHSSHCFHLRFESLATRSRFIEYCEERGVNAVFHYQALNVSAMGMHFGGEKGQCPVSESASECLVRLPLHSGMTSSQIDQVIEVVTSFTV